MAIWGCTSLKLAILVIFSRKSIDRGKMNNLRLVLLIAGLFLTSSAVWAGNTIVLSPGQSYTSGDDTVICSDGGSAEPIALKKCQYWDDFNKKCLYESTRYSLRGMECLEQCQHWDSFFARCDYAISCRYQPEKGIFLETSCAEFDDFNKKCLREQQKIIGPGKWGRRRDGGR